VRAAEQQAPGRPRERGPSKNVRPYAKRLASQAGEEAIMVHVAHDCSLATGAGGRRVRDAKKGKMKNADSIRDTSSFICNTFVRRFSEIWRRTEVCVLTKGINCCPKPKRKRLQFLLDSAGYYCTPQLILKHSTSRTNDETIYSKSPFLSLCLAYGTRLLRLGT